MYYDKIQESGYPSINSKMVIVCDEDALEDVNTYNYKIEVILTPEEMFSAAEWCEENLSGAWLVGFNTSGCDDEDDALALKLFL